MPSAPYRPRRRLYLMHRWVGLLFALLGMLVFFSGAVATFHHELDRWASRGDRFASPQDVTGFNLDHAYQAASAGIDPKYLHQVDLAVTDGHPLRFFFHEHVHESSGIKEVGVARTLDPATLAILDERHGERSDAIHPRASHSLARFFLELHIFLLMPETLGLIATGFAGFALLLLIATGTLVHRPSKEKITKPPRTHRKRFLVADLHTLVGSWSLPFTVIVAFTGAFFSFAGVVLVPIVALVAFDGNQEELIRTLVGTLEVADSDAEASLQPIFVDATRRIDGARLTRIGLDQWGQTNANATVTLTRHSPLGDTTYNLVYDGHSGAFLQAKPQLGTKPSFSNTLLALVADLHFGTLLGLITKLLWGLLGFATCALAATGLLVFASRQRESRGGPARFVRAMTVALAGGLPMATAFAFLGWVGAYATGSDDPRDAMTWSFLSTLLLAGLFGAGARVRPALAITWVGAGLALLAAVVLAPMATGIGFRSVWDDATLRPTLIVDASLVATVAVLLLGAWFALRSWRLQAFDDRADESERALGLTDRVSPDSNMEVS